MPTRSETLKLRVTDAELADYKARAGALGMSLSDWIRSLANASARPVAVTVSTVKVADEAPGTPSRFLSERPRARNAMCSHRRRPDEFCPRCD